MSVWRRPITVAILAMGGEGGGVLADWLVGVAEGAGWIAQTTSVPGVAQRTGATVYYLELFPGDDPAARGRAPVLGLMPTAGEVDLAIASELMEAARAVQRGFVTPDRTTLVASTHRVYAMTERIAMGDGRVDSQRLVEACQAACRDAVMADFAALARAHDSVISATLLGAVAATGRLPFARDAFEATIRAHGVGVEGSLRAFAAGYGLGQSALAAGGLALAEATPSEPPSWGPALAPLAAQAHALLPAASLPTALHALRRLAEYQDPAYARLYLDRLRPFVTAHATAPWFDELMRHLALWMSYEDGIRVADLKTRPERLTRVAGEVGAGEAQVLHVDEFLHPRLEEIADVLPAPLGRWLLHRPLARSAVSALVGRGRVVRTTSLRGYLGLWLVAGLRRWRRGSLRYARENAAIERWLACVAELADGDPALVGEVVRMQRLVRGYGDTHARGSERFARVMGLLPTLRARAGAAAALRSLVDAALSEDENDRFEHRLAQVQP